MARGGSRRSALGARQLLFGAAILGVAYFAIQGGEFGTVGLIRQQIDKKRTAKAIVSLQRQVDSLTKLKQSILTDPAVQERIAREEFGMIKSKEILYRFTEPADSAKGARKP
jgi:cell division protein FtsB